MKRASRSDINLALLRAIPLFADLNRNQLEELVKHLSLRRLEKKEVLFHEGERGTECFFVSAGLCALIKAFDSTNSVCVELVSAGEPVGIAAVLDQIAFPLTLRAIQESVIVAFPKDFFGDFLNTHTDLEHAFSRYTRERFRHVQTRFQQIATGSAKQKILSTLSFIISRLGLETFPAELALSKTDLAELASVEPETVMRFTKEPDGVNLLRCEHRGSMVILKSPSELMKQHDPI